MAKPALGRGLGALLGGSSLTQPAPAPVAQQPAIPVPAPDNRERVLRVPLNKIRPSALHTAQTIFRRNPCANWLSSDSGRTRKSSSRSSSAFAENFLNVIAGERRWRAAQLLNLPEVPIITREADDRSVLELALIENLQRENLNAIEEAHGYQRSSRNNFNSRQEEIALKVGKSRAAVANALRLIKLPDVIQKYVREERISVGHAKVILGLADEKNQKLAAERVIKEGLNVRQTEGLVAKLLKRGSKSSPQPETVAVPIGDPHVADLEAKLREVFATKVKLNYAQGKGSLEISFYSDAELERILQILGVNPD